MDFEKFAWYKSEWSSITIDEKVKELFRQCINLPDKEVTDNINALIEKSNKFPVKFPIETVRMKTLKETRPENQLSKNMVSTYPLLHERAFLLMAKFIIFKREYGSDKEKCLYKDMTLPEFIDRLLVKRAVNFMGPKDKYRLITGETGADGWEQVGTNDEKPPLVLASVLSYDEMKLSAMLYVSGHSELINDGARSNEGRPADCEQRGVIIGLIGPRFKRKNRMDYEDILITEEQNRAENAYGETRSSQEKRQKTDDEHLSRRMYREMWADLFRVVQGSIPKTGTPTASFKPLTF